MIDIRNHQVSLRVVSLHKLSTIYFQGGKSLVEQQCEYLEVTIDAGLT